MKNNLNLTLVGKPLDRIDGPLKVTGKARYSAEFPMKKIAYAVPVGSEIANGKIRNIDTNAAEKAPGVLIVVTHKNRPAMNFPKKLQGGGSDADDRVPLQDANIRYSGQYIALVVAESLECAQYAASLIKVTYIENDPLIDFKHKSAERYEAESWFGEKICKTRGVPDTALASAPVKVDYIYRTPTQNHNPMETHATTASWDGSKLTVYDATQGLYNTRKALCDIFELPATDVRVVCKFIGGAFGCKGSMWTHVPLCVMATKVLGRPVKLVLSRPQMFTNVGHRAETEQRVAIGAEKDGTIKSIVHEGTSQTSIAGEFIETFTKATPMLYQSPNVFVAQKLVRLNKGLPTFMRAPGETPGVFALECALDELAFALDMDPIALRMKNYARKDQESGMPFSSKSLDKCYLLGSERIGWEDRKQKPGSRREGDYLIGLGMATATYPVNHFNASCKVVLNGDGSFLFESSTHEMGTGTCTVMAQIGSEELGVPYDKVTFELGDTDLPMAPVSGGSATVSTVGSAVIGAARALKQDLINQLCDKVGSPFSAVAAGDVKVEEGKITAGLNDVSLTYTDALKALNLPSLTAKFDTSFDRKKDKYSMHSFGAQFIEVKVDPDLGHVVVSKAVGVFGNGRIINEKTCRSQVHGGIVMGIGMALQESTVMDRRSGRIVNANLGEYHVPVNADIPAIEGYFVPEEDNIINTVGAKGIGEIGITGVAAAVANAIFNATGKRVRDLPITPDKIFV
ncbi:MAG: xanthine dehydrogenase family protein molybdopterin-binding subunit [Candidatus Obscuribacterales bacterium]|nr:xanthine dehydrogenase family protein molybdopterin-binding subunit [Candidatus Obscuribacterales bacterium]